MINMENKVLDYELFDLLGYELMRKDNAFIVFNKKFMFFDKIIKFDLNFKKVEAKKDYGDSVALNIYEIDAINNFIKQLDWEGE